MAELKKPIVWPEVPNDGESNVLGWSTLYQDLSKMRMQMWRNRATAYEQNPGDFYTAWHWLQNHPIFWYFGPRRKHESTLCYDRGTDEGLEFRPAKVNPNTLRISNRRTKNTLLQMWVEVFPSSMHEDGRDLRLHDVECDTGGATYEEALLKAAEEIYRRHGNDRVVLAELWSGA
jgi:hypothetical protein